LFSFMTPSPPPIFSFFPYTTLFRSDQIIKFTGVGVLCFFIDFAILYCLTEWAGWHYLVSAAAAFTGSVIVNYILSVKFVFDTNRSEEHTSELQSRFDLVCRLLLEKK